MYPAFIIFGPVWSALPQRDPVHNLGVLLVSQILLNEQVAVVARRAFAQPRLVHQLCLFLNWQVLFSVIYALVTSKLNYCNVLCLGLLLTSIWKFQLVQNKRCRQLYALLEQCILHPCSASSLTPAFCIKCNFWTLIMGH